MVPKCMSTQHPDNVTLPFFAEDAELGGEDEVQEAFYAFSHLGCDEQMWDFEGKEVDSFVVKKLLSRYESFFLTHRLGRDVFLTLRVPNPTVERAEAKVLLETLESIPRSFDYAHLFYGDDLPPIFEVILPMTASAECLDRVYRYYCDFVVGKEDKPFRAGDITIAEWIGKFKPERINVIPLFEDMPSMLNAHEMTKKYLQDKKVDYQRVFLARSDPAMNYGLISAVLFNKIALRRLYEVSQAIGVPIMPIIGVGSAPFRGNLRPDSVERVINEYPSVHTFTIQSAFKYDHPPDEVRGAIQKLKEHKPTPPPQIDEKRCLEIVERYSSSYREELTRLAPVINALAPYVPSRRKRKLHVGLFGYPRSLDGIRLPRVITFTAALYSLGMPPEILGLKALGRDDISFLENVYTGFKEDLQDALAYFNPACPFLPAGIREKIEELGFEYETSEDHREITDQIIGLLDSPANRGLRELVLRAASLRKFLG